MKTFKTFLVESTTGEPFHSVKEVPAKKDLLDVHIKLGDATGGIYGKSKLGTTIPDKPLKHLQVNLGKHKYKGWGESFPDLASTGLGKTTLKAHQKHLDNINTAFVSNGESPMRVKQVHVLYDPHRTLVHLENGTHEMAMTYHQGASAASGQRNFITTNGTKVKAAGSELINMHTGEADPAVINRRAAALELRPRWENHNGVNSHVQAGLYIYHGDEKTHQIIWDKFSKLLDQGHQMAPGIPLSLHRLGNNKIRKQVTDRFPHFGAHPYQ